MTREFWYRDQYVVIDQKAETKYAKHAGPQKSHYFTVHINDKWSPALSQSVPRDIDIEVTLDDWQRKVTEWIDDKLDRGHSIF